jgi:hypothetical protein
VTSENEGPEDERKLPPQQPLSVYEHAKALAQIVRRAKDEERKHDRGTLGNKNALA